MMPHTVSGNRISPLYKKKESVFVSSFGVSSSSSIFPQQLNIIIIPPKVVWTWLLTPFSGNQ